MIKKILPYFIVLLFSYWTVKPMLIEGFFPMHDDTQPARIYALERELKNGIFPVRLVDYLGYGYGYPLYNFYAPLPYYFGALFRLGGGNLIISVKMMFMVGTLLSGVFMYLFASSIAGVYLGLVSSLLYVYAPYHAVNIYVRGAVGEYYAYAFLPLLAYGIYRIFAYKPKSVQKFFLILPGIFGLWGILLSHNIFGLITLYLLASLFAVSLFLFIFKKLQSIKLVLLSALIVWGISLSAFFILPAFSERNFTDVNTLFTGGSNFADHFVYFSQLWDSPWGFAGSAPLLSDGLSFKIGKLHIIIAVFSLVYFIYLLVKKRLETAQSVFYSMVIFSAIISLLMTLPVSDIIYRNLPFLKFVQYPWRFLNLALFAVSLMPLIFSKLDSNLIKIIISVSIISLLLIIYPKYFNPKYIYLFNQTDYLDASNLRYTVSRISDEYLPPDLIPPADVSQVPQGIVQLNEAQTVETIKNTASEKIISLKLIRASQIQTNIAFFPGWQALVNGKKIKL